MRVRPLSGGWNEQVNIFPRDVKNNVSNSYPTKKEFRVYQIFWLDYIYSSVIFRRFNYNIMELRKFISIQSMIVRVVLGVSVGCYAHTDRLVRFLETQ